MAGSEATPPRTGGGPSGAPAASDRAAALAGRRPGGLDAAVLAAIGVLCGLLMLLHARSALGQGDRALAAPPDSLGYFSYLPAVLTQGTLDLAGAYRGVLRHRPDLAEAYARQKTPTGLTYDKYPVGPAVLWAPFYLLAHAAALLGASEPDGVGPIYQVAVGMGSVVYGALAFWLIYLAARAFGPRPAALAATVTVWLAGNALHYMTMEPIFAHAPSLFLVSAVVFAWIRGLFERARDWLLLGLAGGLLLAVRAPDAVVVALIALAALAASARAAHGGADSASAPRQAAALLAGVLLGYLPQLVVQQALVGSPLVSGYAFSPTDRFDWLSPRLGFTLFSAHRGLFVWHPVYLLGLVGLALLWRREAHVAAVGLGYFAALWVVTSAWSSPEQGNAFGGRFFIPLAPFLAFGLTHLLRLPRWGSVVLALAAALVAWNLLFFAQYALNLFPHDAPPTLDDFVGGKARLLGWFVPL